MHLNSISTFRQFCCILRSTKCAAQCTFDQICPAYIWQTCSNNRSHLVCNVWIMCAARYVLDICCSKFLLCIWFAFSIGLNTLQLCYGRAVQKRGQLQLALQVHRTNDARKRDTNQRGMYVCICVSNGAFTAVIFRAVHFSDQLKSFSILVSQKWLDGCGSGRSAGQSEFGSC